jgi:predicted nucleic acid-binding protein
MDTSVLYAAFYSTTGASFEIFRRLRLGEWTAVLSNHLVHEYEEILKSHGDELSLSLDDVGRLLDAICARAEEWPLAHGWEPILQDPDDEPLVQLAVESGPTASSPTTPATSHPRSLGIEVLKPGEFLAKLQAS